MPASRMSIARAMAVIESTYGTNPGFTPASHGCLLYDVTTPVAVETDSIDIQPLSGSNTQKKAIIGAELTRFTGKTFLQGSGAAGTRVKYATFLQICGMNEQGSAGSYVYKPRAASSGYQSASIGVDLDGISYETNGAFGNVVISGSAAQGIEVNFDCQGRYVLPAPGSPSFGSWAGGTNRAQAMKSMQLAIVAGGDTWNGASTEGNGGPLVFKSFSFDRGMQIERVLDGNSATGLHALSVVRTTPTLEIVVEAKQTIGTGDIPDFNALRTAGTTIDVGIQMGAVAGDIVLFDFPELQITSFQPQDGGAGRRNWVLQCRVQSDTDEGEFTMTTK